MIVDENFVYWMRFIWGAADYISFFMGIVATLLVEFILSRINRLFQ